MNPTEYKSETPETDATQANAGIQHQGIADKDWPWAAINEGWTFARKLELERDQARRDLEVSIEQLNRIADRVVEKQTELDQFRARVGELEKDKERLIDALKSIRKTNDTSEVLNPSMTMIRTEDMARQAIDDAMKGQE